MKRYLLVHVVSALLLQLPLGSLACHSAILQGSRAMLRSGVTVGKAVVSKNGITRIAAYGVGGGMMAAGDVAGDAIRARIEGENNFRIVQALQSPPQSAYKPTVKITEVTDEASGSTVRPTEMQGGIPPNSSPLLHPMNPLSLIMFKHILELTGGKNNSKNNEEPVTPAMPIPTDFTYLLITFGVAGACAVFLVIILSFFLCLRRQYRSSDPDYSVKFAHEA